MVKSVTTVCSEIYDEVRKLAPHFSGQRGLPAREPRRGARPARRGVDGAQGAVRAPRARRHRPGRPAPAPGAVRRRAAMRTLAGIAVPDARRVEEYVSAIETHLRARRGVEHILSPRDFALARAWYEAGVPLATVLVGMDRAFEQTANVTSLAYCRRRVEELAAAGPAAAQPSRSPRGERSPFPKWSRSWPPCSTSSRRCGPARGTPSSRPCARSARCRISWPWPSRPNWEYVRAKLREIDDDVSAAVLTAFTADQIDDFRSGGRARHRAPSGPGRRRGPRGRQGAVHPAAGAREARVCRASASSRRSILPDDAQPGRPPSDRRPLRDRAPHRGRRASLALPHRPRVLRLARRRRRSSSSAPSPPSWP